MDEVNRIWDLFGEFTALDVEQGLQTKAIIEIQSRFSYSVTKRTAGRYYGSAAKVLMGQHSDDEIDVILDNIKPVPTSKNCVTDKVKLKAQFKKARRQGYYMSRKEIHEGIMGISVPINNYVYPVVLSIVAPEERLLPLASNAIQEMIKSADIISAKIANSKK